LGSRTTLYEPARLEQISAAMTRQKRAVQPTRPSCDRNITFAPNSDVARLRKQLNELRGYVAQIAINAHRMGLQPDLLLSLSQLEMETTGMLNSDRLVIQYLSAIGLLAKLDTNVRGLGR
jgi:hypothetical protein